MRTRLTLPIIVLVLTCGCRSQSTPVTAAQPSSFDAVARDVLARLDGSEQLQGLNGLVEVLRDQWGVPHIYASTQDDLFFAQGFVTAQDRLWQMEMNRRVAQGRVAEIVGPSGVPHDRLVRLLRYRGPLDDAEWTTYHPDARRIFEAYVRGINAFIARAGDRLPVEFTLTGLRPQPWAAEEILYRARVTAAISSARSELRLAQQVAQHGAAEANRRARPDPHGSLVVPDGLDVRLITDEVLAPLEGILDADFPKPALLPAYSAWPGAQATGDEGAAVERSPGSNNWAVAGAHTATGKPIMVDDPHRQVTLPAWRYLVHLTAPGWNVIGATEPGLPGVIRGHNGAVAWGRTATGTDEADVFVEELNPANHDQVKWGTGWEPVRSVTETIAVKGEAPRSVTVRFSRHGPIFHEDPAHHRAYALRSSLTERGTAEYIGGLRMDQATSARDCLVNGDFMRSPPTNLVCASADGAIALRVSAAAPNRRGWDGRLPVPGTGAYEWDGLRDDLPHELNPSRGWIATANNNIHPPGFAKPLFYSGRPPYWRYERIAHLLETGIEADTKFTVEHFRTMLRDAHKGEAAQTREWFSGWSGTSAASERARRAIAEWDLTMGRESAAAAIYETWSEQADLDALRAMPSPQRQQALEVSLERTMQALSETQGTDPGQWRWGRTHFSLFAHPLASAFDLPGVERDGGADTVNATGAVYRLITDFADPDRSMVTFGPGNSGQPGSPFYGNLLEGWARGEFFPLAYTRRAVERVTRHRLQLQPASPASAPRPSS